MSEQKHTPGPWCWTYVGDKINGYVIGTAWDENDKQLSGHIDEWDFDEVVAKSSPIVEHEGATVNYADALLIAAAPDMLEALELHRAYEATPTDRGGANGPKGRARAKWLAARDAALAKAKGDGT